MSITIISLFVIMWLFFGALCYAIIFAHFQREFMRIAKDSYYSDRRHAIAAGLAGPLGVLAALVVSQGAKHGLKWK